VAGGQLFVVDGLGWLFNGEHAVAGRPDAQGAIMARRIADGIALGCRHLVTEAGEETPDSPNPAYHSLLRTGFRLANLRRNWIGTAAG